MRDASITTVKVPNYPLIRTHKRRGWI